MWIYNAKKLGEYFHVYAIDTIGGPGKSSPNENYNKSFNQIRWIDELFSGIHIDKAYLAGVSNGSYMAQHYSIIRPDKVIKVACMSGSISVEGNSHPMKNMMKVFLPEALFPTSKNVVKLIKKLTGTNSKVFTENKLIMEHYTYLLKGFNNMAMSYHKIKYFNEDEIRNLHRKCLFLLGDADPMGLIDKEVAKLKKYNLEYEIYNGVGHGINHEIAEKINKKLIEYFQ
jgi:pimeloyl-ACP methyl ester carboxylesterase